MAEAKEAEDTAKSSKQKLLDQSLKCWKPMKTPAINKSEVFGRLFRKLTTVTKNMLEYKVSMSCSKKPARRETAGGVSTLILLSLSLSSLPPPKKRQDKGRHGPGRRESCHSFENLEKVQGAAGSRAGVGRNGGLVDNIEPTLRQASSGSQRGRAGTWSQLGLSLHLGVWALFPEPKKRPLWYVPSVPTMVHLHHQAPSDEGAKPLGSLWAQQPAKPHP